MPSKTVKEILKKILSEIDSFFNNQQKKLAIQEIKQAIKDKDSWVTETYQSARTSILKSDYNALEKIFKDSLIIQDIGLYVIRELILDPNCSTDDAFRILYGYYVIRSFGHKRTVGLYRDLSAAKGIETKSRNRKKGTGPRNRKTKPYEKTQSLINKVPASYLNSRHSAAVWISEEIGRSEEKKIGRSVKTILKYFDEMGIADIRDGEIIKRP